MTVRLRSIFDEIPTYRPGECPDEEEGDQLIKMSSNELPWGPSEQLKTSLLSAFESINRYPDFYKQNLSIELAKYTNMQPENIFADDGSGTLLQDLVRLVVNDGDEVVFGSPSFAAYDIDVLLRTFSKAFGMAGLRLGYGLARPEIVDAVNKVVAEFSVSSLSQAVGVAMLQDETIMADLKAKRNIIVAEREKYQDFLREMKVDFIPSQSNFIMIPGDSMELFAQFRQHQLIVRPFDDPAGVRITVGTPKQMLKAREVWE